MVSEVNSSSGNLLEEVENEKSKEDIFPVTHNLGSFSVLARLVRLAIFRFASLSDGTWYEWFGYNRLLNIFSGYGICGCGGNFDAERAQRTKDALLDLGGEEKWVIPSDREACLEVVRVTAASLKSKIENLGGSWEKDEDRIVIRQPKNPSPEWNSFYEKSLKKFFREVDENPSILITSTHAKSIPFGEENRKTKCVLFPSMGKPFAMKKLEMSYFLGKGIDILVYNPRGASGSKGYPSVEGFNCDIEAIGKFALKSYKPKEICIYGSCGESFPGFDLFAKWHSKGVNIIFDNAPASLDRAIGRVNKIAVWLFGFARKYIYAPFESKCRGDKRDDKGFDSWKKLTELERSNKAGYVVLVKTPGDTMALPKEIDKIGELLEEKGNQVTILENDPKKSLKEKGYQDPHFANAFRNPNLENFFSQVLFLKKDCLDKN